MIKAALEYINGLKAPSIESYGGGTYSDKPLYQMKRPDFPTLEMNTLESVVRYLKGIDDEREWFDEPTPTIIHIENERCVTLKDIANVAEGKATILQVVGNLKEDAVRTMTDDGVSQVTAVRTGVATVADVKVPNPVSLRPFRTFIEVDQPESRFIFRMREGGRCAIFEADGGAWKLEAKKNIYNYLKEQLDKEVESGAVVLIL